MNVYDFAAIIEAKRSAMRDTHGVQLGSYTNEPHPAANWQASPQDRVLGEIGPPL